jgi:ferredoxin
MSDSLSPPSRSGQEPELGGDLRLFVERSGYEPELGGPLREKGVYVDEMTCIGCKHCAHVAPHTFFIEAEYGRSRVFNQDGDAEPVIQEAIDTCPVDCIHWVNYTELKALEVLRRTQEIKPLGFPQSHRKLAPESFTDK